MFTSITPSDFATLTESNVKIGFSTPLSVTQSELLTALESIPNGKRVALDLSNVTFTDLSESTMLNFYSLDSNKRPSITEIILPNEGIVKFDQSCFSGFSNLIILSIIIMVIK